MSVQFCSEESPHVKKMMLVYEWAQRTLLTKLSIIREDLVHSGDNNPIESINGRIKSQDSIAGKLHRLGVDITAANAKKHIRDIAGIRVICPFSRDIYFLVKLLKSMHDITILDEKDYVTHPKPSGYRSYHVIIDVPVFYSGKTENVLVELQIRTEAMNFWATLEHKARYKYKEHVPQHLSDELGLCADKIADLDKRMFLIHEIITLINQDA